MSGEKQRKWEFDYITYRGTHWKWFFTQENKIDHSGLEVTHKGGCHLLLKNNNREVKHMKVKGMNESKSEKSALTHYKL